jgi:putative OPT family oligopeptide transporter
MTTKSGAGKPDVVSVAPEAPATVAFQPYVPASANLPELRLLPIIAGTILGMIFGASSLYLVLKVGLTVSASIPVAVISITLFKILSKFGAREATILENNIVQTAGSAGESIAFGVGVTMPAIMILGYDLEITRVMLVAVLGGLLGILMMIPLRRALIVAQHGKLKYPEGTACAEVLKAGASAESKAARSEAARRQSSELSALVGEQGTRAQTIFTGFGIGLLYKTLMVLFHAWKDTPEKIFGAPFKTASIAAEISPELLGVGYIIGPRLGAIMCAGGVLSYLVLIPAITFFGENVTGVVPPGTLPIREMGPNQIRGAYVLYIGAGAVAAGGIISVFRSLPMIWHGLKEGLRDFTGVRPGEASVLRTDRDLPLKFVLGGIIAIILAITFAPPLHMNLLGAILIVVFGFVFVTVSSRLTGEIGSTSNPISGMTVATLLLTCLIFLLKGWTGPHYFVTALSVGAIVCIASSNGGSTSQDLKTGFLVGSTPSAQQIAILIGALGSALLLGPILLQLNTTGTVYVPRITFQKVEKAKAVPGNIPLAPMSGDTRPPAPGSFRLLHAGAGVASQLELPPGDYLVDEKSLITWKLQENFPPNLSIDRAALKQREKLTGPQAGADQNEYFVWHNTDERGGQAGRYLVNDQGVPVYLVDPGINGTHRTLPDGTPVTKFDAPKATLMSYIIKGILNRELPWGLVLLGVMIAITLEMSGVPSLAFAVGVYLPLSASSPIFIGGLVRWLVDLFIRRKHRHSNLTEDQLVAEGDKSPGVLLSSGYIAGGAIAGIAIAFVAGLADPSGSGFRKAMTGFNAAIQKWSASNPFFEGPHSDLLALIPFLVLVVILYLTGRERIMSGRKRAPRPG